MIMARLRFRHFLWELLFRRFVLEIFVYARRSFVRSGQIVDTSFIWGVGLDILNWSLRSGPDKNFQNAYYMSVGLHNINASDNFLRFYGHPLRCLVR